MYPRAGNKRWRVVWPAMLVAALLAAPVLVATSGTAASALVDVPACRTQDLNRTLVRDGGAAGSTYYILRFTNLSIRACSLRGFPGVSADAGGHQIGSAATWVLSPIPKRTLILQPRASVHTQVRIVNAGNYPAATCRRTAATALKIYPPNNTEPVWTPARFVACANPAVHLLSVWPVQAGPGTQRAGIVVSSRVALTWQWPNLGGRPYGVTHRYTVPPLPVLRRIEVGRHETERPAYDRICFRFTRTFPSYDLYWVPRLVADPSDRPVAIEGDGVLRIRFFQADAHDANGRSTVLSAPPAHVGYPAIASYAQAGDFEGVVTYGVGAFRKIHDSNVQPKVRVYEVKKTDGAGGYLYTVAIDIQTASLGR